MTPICWKNAALVDLEGLRKRSGSSLGLCFPIDRTHLLLRGSWFVEMKDEARLPTAGPNFGKFGYEGTRILANSATKGPEFRQIRLRRDPNFGKFSYEGTRILAKHQTPSTRAN